MVVPSAMGETDDDWRFRTSAGRVSPLYEMRVVADDGMELPADGVSVGELKIRGPMVASSYLDLDVDESHFRDGWLRTGDVGTIEPERLDANHRSIEGRDQVGGRVD